MMVSVKGWVLEPPALSVTFMLKLADVTAVVGVPLTAPLVTDRPAGGVPLASENVYPLPDPPLAASGCEYTAPTSPWGNGEAVVMVGPAMMVSVKGWVLEPPALSVTFMLKLADVTAVVGVPLTAPPVIDSPAGGVPLASENVYPLPDPPLAVSGCE